MFHGKSYTMPDSAPLYPEVPYEYKGYRKLSVLCKANPEGIRKALPVEFEPVGDVIEVFLMSIPEVGGLDPYMEGGIVIPCRYGDIVGAHVVYEYVTDDDSMAAGREIWGYPKKLCRMTFEEKPDRIVSTLTRRGTEIIRIELTPDAAAPYEPPKMQPRLQLKRFVRADGQGFDMDQIILNELTGATVHEEKKGRAQLTLRSSKSDPLDWLNPVEVVGASFFVADFVLGYGKILK
jgi:Acetoacetate decarboxylase